MSENPHRIVFYDGDCGFCNRSVNYVLTHDTSKTIHYASLQSEFTQKIFQEKQWPEPDLSTFYFMENGILFEKSKAAFKVLRYFPWYLKWLQLFKIVPLRMRDWVYDQVAKRRRRISKNYCVMPKESDKHLFVG